MHSDVKIIIVDDHPIVRHGITQLISQEKGLSVCAEAESAQGALESIEKTAPDLAVIDISLKNSNGLSLIKEIRTCKKRDIKILVISMHQESLYAERALRAGAQGYITKQEAIENIIHAIKEILQGNIYLSGAISSQILKKKSGAVQSGSAFGIDHLSNRELEVFQLLGKGLSTRQIAENLGLSIKTIEAHRANIKEKLNIPNASQLVQRASSWASTM